VLPLRARLDLAHPTGLNAVHKRKQWFAGRSTL